MLKLFNMTDPDIKQKVQIVVTTDDSILLLKLNDERGGFWQNATGSVERNETFIDAAQRELLEETGIKVSVKSLPLEFKFHDRWGFDVVEKTFHCHLPTKIKVILSDEHQAYKWVSYKKLSSGDYEYENHYQAADLTRKKK